ncbi:MAG: Smr/MutS family protein, partial [Firmicutes bacterium]|nr:Smr/MutS family protein [Bacillota bacterium]
LACNMRASRPSINTEGLVDLRKARHPLIDPKKVVPISVSIGGDYDTLVITGPNTGGKTVTLKTVGLLCLMAQSGLFVPASDGTTVCVFSNIFADIGDEQSIEQSLSTFSSHMVNIVDITARADRNSLVLADELGAGTDPSEGAALAMAVLDHLYGKGVKTIATTHYTELKKYALATPGVCNASMQFDVETLSPTYRLMVGIPGKSNAFEISEKLGLDPEIIGHARNLMESGDIAFEDVIASIEADRKQAEAERAEADELLAEMRKQRARMEKLEKKLKDTREEILEEARAQAKDLLEEARLEINEVGKAIEESKTAADESARAALERSIQDGKRRLQEKKKRFEKKEKKPRPSEKPVEKAEIKLGGRVNLLSIGQKATVLSLPDDKGDMMVQAGQMKLSVNINDVSPVQENVTEKERLKVQYSRLVSSKTMTVPMSINVIGKNLDDAVMEVDKYIDDASMAHLETVTVIHGRGAGILKNGLSSMLRRNRHVDSIRSGSIGEGGDGVTVVKLKK